MKIVTTILAFLLSIVASAQNQKMQKTKEDTLISFTNPELFGFWSPLTDQIRGGNSVIFMEVLPNETSKIYGELNLNSENAGFASFRVSKEDNTAWNLKNKSVINVTSKGDGRVYKLLVKDEATTNSVIDYSWQAQILTKNSYKKNKINLALLKPVYRGQIIKNVPPLDTSKIVELGIQINDKIPGKFEFNLKSITAN